MTMESLLLALFAGAAGGLCAWLAYRERSKLECWLAGVVEKIESEEKEGDEWARRRKRCSTSRTPWSGEL